MRTLLALLASLVLASCASLQGPPPLTGADIVELSKSGRSPAEIIAEIQRTNTVLPLNASDIVRLHSAGVSNEVLDYLQRAQIEEMRWRDRTWYGYGYGGYGGFYRGWGPCPFPTSRGSPWPCYY
jgi:hypothetical protein